MRSRKTITYKMLASLLVMIAYLVTGAAYAQQSNTKTTVTYFLTDAQGNVLATTDAQGNITARYTYRPYGTQQTGPTNAGPGYTGHVNDPDTGLIYMQQRYYDPDIGRFISPDPIGPVAGNVFNFNRFVYANNNPVVNIDLDGRETGRALQSINWGVKYPQVPAGPAGKVIGGTTIGLVALPVAYLIAPEATAAAVRLVVHQVVRKVTTSSAKNGSKSLKDQAASLVEKNGGKNRVTIELPSQKIEIDLAGKSHGGIETPHVKVSERNLKAPNQPAYNTKSSQVRPATQDDIDMARRHLDQGE